MQKWRFGKKTSTIIEDAEHIGDSNEFYGMTTVPEINDQVQDSYKINKQSWYNIMI